MRALDVRAHACFRGVSILCFYGIKHERVLFNRAAYGVCHAQCLHGDGSGLPAQIGQGIKNGEQNLVAGGLRKQPMEFQVQLYSGGGLGCGGVFLDVGPEQPDFLTGRANRRQASHAGFNDQPSFGELFQAGFMLSRHKLKCAHQRAVWLVDRKHADAVLYLDQALHLKVSDRFTHDGSADAGFPGQIALGGEQGIALQGQNPLGQALGYLLNQPRSLDHRFSFDPYQLVRGLTSCMLQRKTSVSIA